jgi:uncharacterized membrane protein
VPYINSAPLLSLLHLETAGGLIRSFTPGLAAWALPSWASWQLFLTYLVGLIFLVAGFLTARSETHRTGVLDRLLLLGPVFLAAPMAVFGMDHFFEAQAVSRIVPSWIPWHMFWTYFVGVALICAAVSIVLKRYVGLSAALLGTMFLLFEALMHIPAIIKFPHARIAWSIALRDINFAAGAFALAITQTDEWQRSGTHRFLWAPRFLIGLPMIIFGVEYFFYPLLVPGIPLRRDMPAWIPVRPVWNYATGVIQVVTGICLVINRKARLAAIWLGITILLVVLFIYVPIMVANASSIDDGLNYVMDTLALSGAALLLARSQSKTEPIQSPAVSQPQQAATG